LIEFAETIGVLKVVAPLVVPAEKPGIGSGGTANALNR